MSSQLVDINGDGHNDILAGSYEGVPFLIAGSEEGYSKPERIVDGEGQMVVIADFWNDDTDEWDSTDRAKSKGHCTSVAAVDWDADGDQDLLLGSYDTGQVFLRLNEGTKTEPKFATTNEPVLANKKPLIVEGGLTTPRVIDFDNDGLFDILCGGTKGGAYLYRNTGTAGKPKFAAARTLVEPIANPQGYVFEVPSYLGEPTMPGSSWHVEMADYDRDGDLDLLVGARCSWKPRPVVNLSEKQQQRVDDLEAKLKSLLKKIVVISKDRSAVHQAIVQAQQALAEKEANAKSAEVKPVDEKALAKTDAKSKTKSATEEGATEESLEEMLLEFEKLKKKQSDVSDQYVELDTELSKLKPKKLQQGDFVWLFRRK